METCNDDAVEAAVESGHSGSGNSSSRKYLLRQILVCSGVWAAYFSAGLNYGSPTVFIPQIRKEANSSDAISVAMASWLSSTFNYSAIASTVILTVLARLIGRKLSFLIICTTALIGYIILYYSTTVTQILIGEVIHGPILASATTISIMILTEYTSPRYRGVFLTLKSATFLWGIWVANTIGTFVHWKNIVSLAFVCTIYSTLTCMLWPESPYWLANKYRFEDCAASHRWLKGCSKESVEELNMLIQARRLAQPARGKSLNVFKKLLDMITNKIYYKSTLLSMLVVSLYHFSGKIACGMYAIDIIKGITENESTAYTGMLILDGIAVLGMYIGCGLSRMLKRRTLLLTSSTLGVAFLLSISLYLHLIHLEIISEDTIISISLLMGYSLAICVGPMILATTILGELIPLKYRSSSILVLGCFANFLMGSIVKVAPFVLQHFEARGLFLFFAICELLLVIANYKILPETKDKTIIEIQEIILGTKSDIKSVDYLTVTD